MRLTPRFPKHSTQSAEAHETDNFRSSQPIYFTIARSMYDYERPEGSPDLFADTPISISTSSGKHHKLLARIEFPVPPVKLPHEEDEDAVFEALSAPNGNNHQEFSSDAPVTPRAPAFITLLDLVGLAYAVRHYHNSLPKLNRFAYCSMLFLALRSHACADVVVPGSWGRGPTIIRPDDSAQTIGQKLKQANVGSAQCSVFDAVGLPEINEISREWEDKQEEINAEIRNSRLRHMTVPRRALQKAGKDVVAEVREHVRKRPQERGVPGEMIKDLLEE